MESQVPNAEVLQLVSGQDVAGDFPGFHPSVFQSPTGERFLRSAGVGLVCRPQFSVENLRTFLKGFDPALGFEAYADDGWENLTGGEAIIKASGQLCYLSFGPKRSLNKDVLRYVDHILESRHGSVLEHANYSLLFYGIDRAVTHELVRHRAGFGFSQCSQRYVTPATLRFVQPLEMQGDAELERIFLEDIHDSSARFERRVEALLRKQGQDLKLLSGDSKTELRKKVQQVARRVLPNEVEAPTMVTGNLRAWRHAISMRADGAADVAIRDPFVKALRIVKSAAPSVLADFVETVLADGTIGAAPKNWKV